MAGEELIHYGQQRKPKPFLRKGEVLRFALAAGYERTWARRSDAERAGTWDRANVDAYRAQEWAMLILDCTAPILSAELMRIPNYWRAFKAGAMFGLQHWDSDGTISYDWACLTVEAGRVTGTKWDTEGQFAAYVENLEQEQP